MKAKISLVVFFVLANSLLTSCFFTCEPAPAYFKITGLQSSNMKFTNSGLNPWEQIENNANISWETFFVRVGFQKNYIAQSQFQPNGSLFALSCEPPGHAGDKIGVDTLIIRTVYDYNGNYSAGDIINSIILMNDWTYDVSSFDRFFSIQDYIINNTNGVKDEYFEMKLSEAPNPNSPFAIQLTYKLKNGEEFNHVTDTINLQ